MSMEQLKTDEELKNYWINTGCSVVVLAEIGGIGVFKARKIIMDAILLAQERYRLQKKLFSIEMAEQENEL